MGVDEFLVSDSMTLALPGILDTYAFQISFQGQSIALRRFLNRIVNAPLPYAVRGVEVRFASESGAKSEFESLVENPFVLHAVDEEENSTSSVPIISDNRSHFVITLEFLDLVAEIEEPELVSASGRERDGV